MWPFPGKKRKVVGEEIGEATVTDKGDRKLHLHFFPNSVDVAFIDAEPDRPGCPPLEQDMVEITANGKTVIIRWRVAEPRKIKWVVKS